MKRILVLFMLSAGIYLTGTAQIKSDVNINSVTPEETILRVEKELTEALLKGEPRGTASSFDRYTSDSYVFTDPSGRVHDKKEMMQNQATIRLTTAKVTEMNVQVYGNTAVVTFSRDDAGIVYGKPVKGANRWTIVYLFQDGRWQRIAGQATRVAQQ